MFSFSPAPSQTLIRLSHCALLIPPSNSFGSFIKKKSLVSSIPRCTTTCTGTLARGQSQPCPRQGPWWSLTINHPPSPGRLTLLGLGVTGCGQPFSLVGRSGASRRVMARSAATSMVRVGVARRCGRMTAALPVLPVGFVCW